MEFKLLVMVKNLCARNIIQNAVQGISKAPDLFLNKHKIMRCFPKFQVYKHIARKMRLSKFIVDWEISCLRADDHLVHKVLARRVSSRPTDVHFWKKHKENSPNLSYIYGKM